jgi:tetratricopeptide (TPR) repeat protein
MGKAGSAAIFIFFALAALFAASPASPEGEARRDIRIVASGAERPIELRSVTEEKTTVGRISETTVDMVFFNPNNRVLVGELYFPLSDGQTVTEFALEMEDGELRKAAAVDKAKGREAFEDVTRMRIDPALLEIAGGNNFKMRVYPLNPGGTRRVRVTYAETAGIQEKSGSIVVGEFGGEKYFYAEVPVGDIFSAERTAQRRSPKIVSILWDASLSGMNRDRKSEFKCLSAYFDIVKNARVRLQVARDRAEPMREFDVTDGRWDDLRQTLSSAVFDGATNLGAFEDDEESDIFLLFTDGLGNYGVETFSPPKSAPLYALVSSRGADYPKLRHLADETGGSALDLSRGAKNAASSMTTEKARLVDIKSDGSSNFVYSYPETGDATVAVAGTLDDTAAGVTLVFALPDGSGIYKKFRDVKFRLGPFTKISRLAPRMWASMKLAKLQADKKMNKGGIRRLGRAFNMATSETSLIVLDRVADYARYEITPPDHLRAAYDKLTAFAPRSGAGAGKLARIKREWQDRIMWWNGLHLKIITKRNGLNGWNFSGGTLSGQSSETSETFSPPADSAPPPAYSPQESGGVVAGAVTEPTRPARSDAEYMARLSGASGDEIYRIYLDERPDYIGSTAFYLRIADILFDSGKRDLALSVLSNLAEISPENRENMRALGYKLMEFNEAALAVRIFKDVLSIAPDEPASYRDLGLAYAAAGDMRSAAGTLYKVVSESFPRPFAGMEVVALNDINDIIARSPEPVEVEGLDPIFLKKMPLALRAVLSWNSDNTVFELIVTGPDEKDSEPVHYSGYGVYPGGGNISGWGDGYGPIEFALKNPKPGKYRVEAVLAADRRQTQSAPPVIAAAVSKNFCGGEGAGTTYYSVIQSKGVGERIFIGEVEIE